MYSIIFIVIIIIIIIVIIIIIITTTIIIIIITLDSTSRQRECYLNLVSRTFPFEIWKSPGNEGCASVLRKGKVKLITGFY